MWHKTSYRHLHHGANTLQQYAKNSYEIQSEQVDWSTEFNHVSQKNELAYCLLVSIKLTHSKANSQKLSLPC